jgi:hypothetical protein
MKRVAIYLRVSTSKQDTENQRRELIAVAERAMSRRTIRRFLPPVKKQDAVAESATRSQHMTCVYRPRCDQRGSSLRARKS